MIQVIDRSIDILELLGTVPNKKFTLAEISQDTGIQKSTCANILKTLVSRNYVESSGKMKGYQLGYKAYRLVNSPEYYDALAEIAREDIQQAFDAIGETVVLAVIVNDKRLVIEQKECSAGITAKINHATNLYRAATSRVIIANYPLKKRLSIIERAGMPDWADWPEVHTEEQLMASLDLIKDNRFALIKSSTENIIGLAVPIFKNDVIIASIGVCLPVFRYDFDKHGLIIRSLRKAADSISAKLSAGLVIKQKNNTLHPGQMNSGKNFVNLQ